MASRRHGSYAALPATGLVSLVFVLTAFFPPVVAQTSRATILGTVKDETGAVLPGVTITARHVRTDFVRTAITSNSGDYVVPELPVGEYEVSAELPGFRKEVITGLVLQVDQRARIDMTLKVGEVTERITVTGEAPIVQSESSAVGTVIENKKILDLPLNGRDFAQLATLTPGAILRPSQPRTFSRSISVHGTPGNKTEYLLDGISNQDQLFEGIQFTPSIDALQEFKIQSNAFAAEFGRGGAMVNIAVKSGTNELHGTVFEFLRNDLLDARNFFAKTVEPLKRNQFGFSLGGPIKRNKAFLFGNYEGTRERRGKTFNSIVPTEAQRRGDFSGGASLFNPFTIRPNPNGSGFIRDPFPNNRIPIEMISPQAAFFFKFIPPPNSSDGRTFVRTASETDDPDQANIRVDVNITEKTTFFARYSISDRNKLFQGPFPENGASPLNTRNQNVVVSFTHTSSPTLLHEFRFGYGRMFNTLSIQGLGTNFTVQAGITGFEETSQAFPGFPQLAVSGFGPGGGGLLIDGGLPSKPIINPTNNFQWIYNVTYTKASHTMKAGFDFRRFNWLSTNSGQSRGNFRFTGAFTQDPQSLGGTGHPLADFLLGIPFNGQRSFLNARFGWFPHYLHFYFQDDVKVSPKLTLNYGLRYEANFWPTSVRHQVTTFDFRTGRVIVAVDPKTGTIDLTAQPSGPFAIAAFPDLIVPLPESGLKIPNNTFREFDANDFAPRFGFAWRPFGDNKTVLRGAYGIFYFLPQGNAALNSNIPFRIIENLVNNSTSDNPRTLADYFRAPFGAAVARPSFTAVDTHSRTPYLQQWNLVFQREIVPNLAFEIGYVGSKGTKLELSRPTNVPPPGSGPVQSRRPYPRFTQGSIMEDSALSAYHALEIKAEKRFSQGLSFLAAYNASKSIDFIGDVGSISTTSIQDPDNIRSERAVSDFDVPHRFVFSYIYELPLGKGKRFLNNSAGALSKLITGWQTTGIVVFQSGFPFTPRLSFDNANTGQGPHRPNRIGSGKLSDPTVERWFNPRDFAVPAPFHYGNSGRNILRQDGIKTFDFALFKNTYVSERVSLQFRTEVFNLFNHPNFGRPVDFVDSATAGRVLSAGAAREIQFALKLIF